jgi:cytochrome c-type biogenesis protein CcmE
MAAKNSKTVYIVAALLLLGGLAYLVASGVSEGSTPTLEISQALDMDGGELHKVRVFGKVAADGISPHEDGLGVDFVVLDEVDAARAMPVAFRGAVPDTFDAAAEVILKGSWDASAGLFRATQMTTKCPSKYEEQRPEGAQS